MPTTTAPLGPWALLKPRFRHQEAGRASRESIKWRCSATPRTGLVTDIRYRQHDTGPGHPECAERLVAIDRRLKSDGLLKRIEPIKVTPATHEPIERIHDRDYIARVRATCKKNLDFIDTPDSAICSDSYEAAVLAVGGLLNLVDAVMAGKCPNGFAAVRPPGHHAERNLSMGFCLFNNIAVAARHLRSKHKLAKILILDWDVHHGNGTQHSFDEDPTVFYCSLHQHPSTCYPGTGWPQEIGKGPGKGTILNLPLKPGLGNDAYRDAFEKSFLPAARKFGPDFVLVSAGFDAHARDPLASMNVTAEGFNYMARATLALADEFCKGRFVSVLEGGYNLQALAECVCDHVDTLIDHAEKKPATDKKP